MVAMVRRKLEPAAKLSNSLPPLLRVWKSRLPLIVVPVLVGLQQLSNNRFASDSKIGAFASSADELEFRTWEPVLLLLIVVGTGYLRLPFSATWWLVLLAAFGLKTRFLLGVATVLSLTVLLGWYGLRLRYSRATSALWGGARGNASGVEDSKETLVDAAAATGIPLACWCAWDLFVHGLPAVFVLYWHGPWVEFSRTEGLQLHSGTATRVAVFASLFLNGLWLLGLSVSLARSASRNRRERVSASFYGRQVDWLADTTDSVYRIVPKLPHEAWLWVYGSHWGACAIWLALLVMHHEALFVYSVCVLGGLARNPYTNVWWFLFLTAVHGSFGLSAQKPLLEGVVWVCGASTFVGWYGTQLLLPWVFNSLTRSWVVEPARKYAPPRVASLALAFANSRPFPWLMRLGDMFIHFIPTLYALWRFRPTALSALVALPTNLVWLSSTGSRRLADTNRLYGVVPEPPSHLWMFIYGSHWAFSFLVLALTLLECMPSVASIAPLP